VVIFTCILSEALIILLIISPEVIKGFDWLGLRVDLPVLHPVCTFQSGFGESISYATILALFRNCSVMVDTTLLHWCITISISTSGTPFIPLHFIPYSSFIFSTSIFHLMLYIWHSPFPGGTSHILWNLLYCLSNSRLIHSQIMSYYTMVKSHKASQMIFDFNITHWLDTNLL